MGFDGSGIEARGYAEGVSLVVEWESADPPGTVFQVYRAGKLEWAGAGNRAVLPLYPAGPVEVGRVGSGESQGSHVADLPVTPLGCARLSWMGGTYLGADIAGYNVYREDEPGDGVNYASRIAYVPAYGASVVTAGYGDGGYGDGGYGDSSASYAWTSARLPSSGNWAFGVKPVDTAGNEGAEDEVIVTIEIPPGPPASDADGVRLHASYNPLTGDTTLSWLPSPG